MPDDDAVLLRQPFDIECASPLEARNLHAAFPAITTLHGLTVSFTHLHPHPRGQTHRQARFPSPQTMSTYGADSSPDAFALEGLRLEAVTACVGFDDLLDATLGLNHPHLDTMVVVTSHADRRTQAVAKKHGAFCVQTDLFRKNGRNFNKGAALNAGFGRFQYQGWRLHLDADIALPDNFRRLLFNHSHLDRACIYGADRVDCFGLERLRESRARGPLAKYGFVIDAPPGQPLSHRYVDILRGYVPIGYFQLWHASCHKDYPWSIGTAAHDDVLFAEQWPAECRRLLPTAIVQHLCARPPVIGENWDGHRRQPRIS